MSRVEGRGTAGTRSSAGEKGDGQGEGETPEGTETGSKGHGKGSGAVEWLDLNRRRHHPSTPRHRRRQGLQPSPARSWGGTAIAQAGLLGPRPGPSTPAHWPQGRAHSLGIGVTLLQALRATDFWEGRRMMVVTMQTPEPPPQCSPLSLGGRSSLWSQRRPCQPSLKQGSHTAWDVCAWF